MQLRADVVVIGGGLVGCATAVALADRGLGVVLLHEGRAGQASAAAAGMLAPSLDELAGPIRSFATAARDLFPEYVERIRERTGRSIALDRNGVIQVAATEQEAAAMNQRRAGVGEWLTSRELHEMEPGLAPMVGAVLWAEDGFVDNGELLAALQGVVASHERIRVRDVAALAVEAAADRALVRAAGGLTASAQAVVLCAGAWSSEVSGASHAAYVEPVRGQLLAFDELQLGHAVYGEAGYLVPRTGYTVAGTTMERVGFDSAITTAATAAITAGCRGLYPELPEVPLRSWTGLRPVTPDLLPLIGRDPEFSPLIYACGHSRNGILFAPITADVVAALIFEEPLNFSLSQFRPERFAGTLTQR